MSTNNPQSQDQEDEDDREPPEVLVVNKETYLACLKALTIYLSNTFDYFDQVKRSSMTPETKRIVLEILKMDLDTIGNISNALEQCMDYKAEVDVKSEHIN